MPAPSDHEYEVQMDVPALPGRAAVELVFPAWILALSLEILVARGRRSTDPAGASITAER